MPILLKLAAYFAVLASPVMELVRHAKRPASAHVPHWTEYLRQTRGN